MLLSLHDMASTRGSTALRRGVLWLSAALALAGTYWIARAFVVDGRVRFGNPLGEAAPEFTQGDVMPLQVRAEITQVSGLTGVSQGDRCEFLVERRARKEGSFYCNAQVTCAGRLVYGGPER